MRRLPQVLERLVLGGALAVAFLLTASVFVPDYTKAGDRQLPADAPSSLVPPSSDPHAGLTSLGSLESDRYIIRVYAGEVEPLYSVYRADDGTPLAILRTAEQVEQQFPDLPVREMDFGAMGPVMMVAPDSMHE